MKERAKKHDVEVRPNAFAWGFVIMAGALVSLADCSGGGGNTNGASPEAGAKGDASGGGGDAGDRDGGPIDAAKPDVVDASVQLACSLGTPRTVGELGRNDGGHLMSWRGKSRIFRLGTNLARAVVTPDNAPPTVLSFDPTNNDPATTTALPFDVILDVTREDGAIWVYGRRTGISLDAGADAGQETALLLAKVDDATGALTSRTLTIPGAVDTPKSSGSYEPPIGRFARFGTDDVYFTYTEEVGFANNPTYKLSVGRITASSGPVAMTTIDTAGAHDFQRISAAGLIHTGTVVYAFMGAGGVANQSDVPESASQWTLPDDATLPNTITKRGLTGTLLAANRDGALSRFAFVEASTIFGDPRAFLTASSNDTTLATFTQDSTGLTFSNAAAKTLTADAHYEGDQFLWFGPDQGFWFDATLRQTRATFQVQDPTTGPVQTLPFGAITLNGTPTLTSGSLDVLYPLGDADLTKLLYATLSCTR